MSVLPLNISTVKNNNGALLETLSGTQLEHANAIKYVQELSQGVGGKGTGESLMANAAATEVVKKLCPNPATMLQCLESRAYDACYVEKNGSNCRELNMLLGSTMEVAAKEYLAATRTSETDNYFLPPTRRTAPRVISKEIASLLVAASIAKR